MLSKWYHWMLVNDFVDHIIMYRSAMFFPGDALEADESVICWFGVVGAFVNKGLPMYIALEQKPDGGCEIQNLADVSL